MLSSLNSQVKGAVDWDNAYETQSTKLLGLKNSYMEVTHSESVDLLPIKISEAKRLV